VNCDPLPDTGAPTTLLLAVVAVVCLVAGTLLVTRARRERVGPVVLLALLIMAAAYATLSGAPAQAASAGCESSRSDGPDSLSITQTSVLAGLRPQAGPLTITGRVTNDSDDDTYITAVSVTMTSVIKAPHATAGTCDVSDYVLADRSMPVGEALGPHESLTFSGATIGFSNKSVNQDACKGATIQLRYVSAATADPSD
jgi:LPXTG-motif cell wall-anchored protein